MSQQPQRPGRVLARRLKARLGAAAGWSAVGLLRSIRFLPRQPTADTAALIMRTAGPWLPEHRLGRANLTAAFPEKSNAEVDRILAGVWDNLGRFAAEFAHIDRLHTHDPPEPDDDILYDELTDARFQQLRRDDKPALIFAAHLANWELPALTAAIFDLELSVLYRPPNLPVIGDEVVRMRAGVMGRLIPTGLDAPVKLLRVLEAGGHVAMLVDQHFVRGVDVTFFGRPCKANPLIAQLAQKVECPIVGARLIRLPDKRRFRIEMSQAIKPARDAEGRVDIQGTMQAITSVVEGWVREYPDQWLWLHRRWR